MLKGSGILDNVHIEKDRMLQSSMTKVQSTQERSVEYVDRDMLTGLFSEGEIVKKQALQSKTECVRTLGSAVKSQTNPTFPIAEMTQDGCKLISSDTLLKLLHGEYGDMFDHFIIVDCRYDYEYKGGYIKGALHIQDKKLLTKLFDSNRAVSDVSHRNVAWIFYCEFSKHRGPQ
ncbi:hypothetical protein RFI_12838, partial [Reticulomyxa filosa]